MARSWNDIKEQLKRLSFVAAIYRRLHPTNSTCGCCGLPWAVARGHTIEMRHNDGSGFFPVCEYCWKHKSQEEIDTAIIRLYHWWEYDCKRLNIEVPYKLSDMLSAAVAQKTPELIGERCATCSHKCKKMKEWFHHCEDYVDNRMYNLFDR